MIWSLSELKWWQIWPLIGLIYHISLEFFLYLKKKSIKVSNVCQVLITLLSYSYSARLVVKMGWSYQRWQRIYIFINFIINDSINSCTIYQLSTVVSWDQEIRAWLDFAREIQPTGPQITRWLRGGVSLYSKK